MNKLCKHYIECGGCELQHLNETQYQQYKHTTLQEKLDQAEIFPQVLNPIFIVGPYRRRRCTLQINYYKGVIELGFYKKKSHSVVNIQECFILTPEIFNLLEPLKKILAQLKKPQSLNNIYILNSHSGLDLLIHSKSLPELKCLENLAEFATKHNIARISWQTNQKIINVYNARSVTTYINNILAKLPPGAFLQTTIECEKLIQQQILTFTQKNKINKIIDLYAGCGTFSLIFDDTKQVLSVEGNTDMSSVVNEAIKQFNLKNKQTLSQDIYNYPLKAEQLARYDLAIIDPPRNGATPQIKELAASKIKTIIMISCNVDSFIRDSKILLSKNYKLCELTPIDQFHWTKHLELLAIFNF